MPQQWGPGRRVEAGGSGLVILLLPLWFVRDGGGCVGSSDRRCGVILDSAGAELVDPVGIDPIDPALVKIDEENHIWTGEERGES